VIRILLLSILPLAQTQICETSSIDTGSRRITYRETGQGEPVLLLHGLADTGDVWCRLGLFQELSADWHVIAPDLRGHGGSLRQGLAARDADGRAMTTELLELLDHLGIERCHVVGFSLGGMIALDLVARAPERLHSATIVGFGLPEVATFGPRMELLAQSLDRGTEGDGFLPLLLPPEGEPEAEELNALRRAGRAMLAVNDATAMAGVVRGLVELVPELPEDPPALPLRVLIGELDAFLEDVDRLRERWPRIEVEVLADTDHIGALRHPVFRDGLAAFLAAGF
jgi:pimeloyl-ACP methyl ester carboxylesterase